jgi:hypothetical protein
MTVMILLLAVRIMMAASILTTFASEDGGWPSIR